MAIILGEELIFRLHACEPLLLLENCNPAVVLTRTWSATALGSVEAALCGLVEGSLPLGAQHCHQLLMRARIDVILPRPDRLRRRLVDEIYVFRTCVHKCHFSGR